MKISFSQGKKSMVPVVGREVAKLCGLWTGGPVGQHHHGEHHCGVTLGVGAGDVWVQAQPVGPDHSTPTLLLSGG